MQPSRHVEELALFPDKVGINQRASFDRVMATHAKSNNTDGSLHVRATGVSRSADPSANHTNNRVGCARRECHAVGNEARDAATCARNAWKYARSAVAEVATRLRVTPHTRRSVTDSRISAFR